MQIDHGHIRLELDPSTGSIVRIANRKSGVTHFDATGERGEFGRLFRIIAPNAQWFSRAADSHLQDAPQIAEEGESIIITYPDLRIGDGRTGIAATVRISPSEREDELLLTISVENHGQHPINEIMFPWLGGWAGEGGRNGERCIVGGKEDFDLASLPRALGAGYYRLNQRMFYMYPYDMYTPWVDISMPGGGLSYINYATSALNGFFSIENLGRFAPQRCLGFAWSFPALVQPGERWTSPPIGLAVHDDDWHATADRYRLWANTVFGIHVTRKPVRESIGVQNVFFRGFDGALFHGLDEIPAIAETGLRYGVDQLCVWDQLMLGHYVMRPAGELFDYAEDEQALLRQGLGQAKAMGVNVHALLNFRHVNSSFPCHQPYVAKDIKRRWDGTPETENWAGSFNHAMLFTRHLGPECYLFSPHSPAYRQRVMALTETYLDLGFTSMFFDQPFEWPDYAYVAEGKRPEDTYPAVIDLVDALYAKVTARDPHAYLVGEEGEFAISRAIEQFMAWKFSDPTNVSMLERIRYSIPNIMFSWVMDSEPDRATWTFALGAYCWIGVHGQEGTLADAPVFAEHVRKLAQLRKRCVERTVYARFNDRRGLCVEGEEGFVAYGYDSPQGPAVIAAAIGKPASGTVSVQRDAFSAPGGDHGRLCRWDGSTQAVQGDTMSFTLEANEVAIWEL
jgi:hypothetical protein